MKRLLKPLVVAVLLTATLLPARAEFGSTNAEKGCTILSLNVGARIDDMPWMTSETCAKMRASYNRRAKETDNWMDCVITMLMTRNRVRGLPDVDKPPLDVRKNVLKGCVMAISDYDEKSAEYITGAVKP
jgi:hypothetical protein